MRLPLQTGSQAILGAAVGSVCIALAVPPLVFGLFLLPAGFWLLFVSAFAGYLGVSFIRDAWRARPSDIELDAVGLRVVGGPKHGLAIAWERVKACKLDRKEEYGTGLLVTVGGKEELLATTMDEDEEASLDAVRRTLLVLRDRTPPPPPEPTTESQVLACTKCGAMAAPAAAARVVCDFCGTPIDMPAAIREKVSTSARLTKSRRTIERHASWFLRSTLSRARWAMVPTCLAVAAWLVALVVGVAMYGRGSSSAWGCLFLVIALGSLAPGVTALFGAVLIGRQAAPVLALNLGARPPVKPGQPQLCRCCGGPLATPAVGVVTQCIFCDADNVLGFSLGREAASAARQAGLLENTVTRTQRARAKWRRGGLAVGAGCLLASTIALLSIRTQVRAEGGARDLRRITWSPFDDAHEPFPSRDGSMILYRVKEHSDDGIIFVNAVVASSGGAGRDAGSGNQQRLAPFSLDDREAMESKLDEGGCAKQHASRTADGRRVAYVANCDGRGRLYVLDVATGVSRLLTSGVAPVDHPHWSGGFIYFDAGGSIYRLRPPA
jgi:hypothetical protein